MIRVLALLLSLALGCPAAEAHLVAAQHGTLNLQGDGAYLALSLPVSAFPGLDEDHDGRASLAELRAHESDVLAQVRREVRLLDAVGALPLDGAMLSLSPAHDGGGATQVVALGRFALPPADARTPLRLRVSTFGTGAEEHAVHVMVTDAGRTQWLVFSPGDAEVQALLPGAWDAFVRHVALGAEHILSGADHLLFLVLLVAAGGGARRVLFALSTFTLGHAITLTAVATGAVSVSSSWVEPAIAATIVAMAAMDARGGARWRHVRLMAVFACSLVHGLGMASDLGQWGLGGRYLVPVLAGFNAGVELAQVGVVATVAAVAWIARRVRGEAGVALASRAASWSAMAAGGAWFVQRVLH